MSSHSRQFLSLLVAPALALGATAATAQTLAPTVPAPERVAPLATDATPAQFRGERRDGRGGGGLLRDAFANADADGNGALTQAEIDQYLATQLTETDANGDGAVALDEFETFYTQRTRDRMVDAFQRLDDDGNGQITSAELSDRFGTVVQRFDRNGDGALSPEDRRGRGERGRRDRGNRR